MKLVYLGDSITAGFNQLNNHKNVINLGISGDKINNLIGRIERVIEENPDRLIIMIGINDFLNMKNYWGFPIKVNIKYMYGVLIKMIHDNLPNTEVILLSILPISIDLNSESLKNYNNYLNLLNKHINNLAKTYGYEYIDINKVFLNSDSILDHKYTPDGVHLNDLGYELYYNLIKEYL